jgi:hypothetical protein
MVHTSITASFRESKKVFLGPSGNLRTIIVRTVHRGHSHETSLESDDDDCFEELLTLLSSFKTRMKEGCPVPQIPQTPLANGFINVQASQLQSFGKAGRASGALDSVGKVDDV